MLEQEISATNPGLFADKHLGVSALKRQLEHLERVAKILREEAKAIGKHGESAVAGEEG